MDTQTLTQAQVDRAAALLRAGELVAFPTETVYGLGALANQEAAVRQVFAVKGRPSDNPLIVHVARPADVQLCVSCVSPLAEALMAHFWPGPLTLILPAKRSALAPSVMGQLTTVAVRMPAHPLCCQLIEQVGFPLVGPSANTSGKPSPTCAAHVLHDLQGKIAAVLDGGDTAVGLESTVLDVSNPQRPVVLRPGAVTEQQLQQFLSEHDWPTLQQAVASTEPPKAPGMKYPHYAPHQPVVLVAPTDWAAAIACYRQRGQAIGLLADDATVAQYGAQVAQSYALGHTVDCAAQRLYAGLRFFDAQPVAIVLAQTYEPTGVGTALMNRLRKAANGQHFS